MTDRNPDFAMGKEGDLEPSKTRDASRLTEQRASGFQVLGILALKWGDLRSEAVAARQARKDIIAAHNGCAGKYHGESCWQSGPNLPRDEWCECCQLSEPATLAYHKAARRAGAALTAFRKEAKRFKAAEAAGPGSVPASRNNPLPPDSEVAP